MSKHRRTRWIASLSALVALGTAGYAWFAVATASDDAIFTHRTDGSSVDVSPALEALFEVAGPDSDRIDTAFAGIATRLRGVRIVIVPSFLADGLLLTNRLGLTDYFESQIAAFHEAGLTIELAAVDTEAGVRANADVLAQLVASSKQPVCFISHSEGSLDVLEYLLAADAQSRKQIVCWLSLHAPFYGSPIADLAAASKPLRSVADPLASLLGGSGRSLDDLTVAVRTTYMTERKAAVRTVVDTIPILAVATRIDAPSFNLPTLYMRPAFDWMAARGNANDGLVPVSSAVLPGARYVVIPGLDHGDTVADNPVLNTPEKRTLLLKALLALTLGAG